jgi:predicted Rossmann fold nucleotide-binding protein DprA/Smf involved in DNA uptake
VVAERTQATLLLTVHLHAAVQSAFKPLDSAEWTRLARWLDAKGCAPEDLVRGEAAGLLDDWDDPRIAKDRMNGLLDRGAALAVALDRWLNSGMWILGRSDDEYPQRLRKRLGESAPPILFGYGEQRHLQHGGVAIVGSRDASVEHLKLAEDIAMAVAVSQAGYSVVSGGARGVDDRAAQGAFLGKGTVIAVLADSLLRNAGKKIYRDHLMSNDLTLLTPYSPESGFSAGNAMGRNRLIYCLADAAIAVSSAKGSGGTFAGASEALRRRWVPVWAVPSDDSSSGNPRLIELGAKSLPPLSDLDVRNLLTVPVAHASSKQVIQHSLFEQTAEEADQVTAEAAQQPDSRAMSVDEILPQSPHGPMPSLFQTFLERWQRLGKSTVTAAELSNELELTTQQSRVWVERAVHDGVAQKLKRPVRYALMDGDVDKHPE